MLPVRGGPAMAVQTRCLQVAEHPWFKGGVQLVIACAVLLMFVEGYEDALSASASASINVGVTVVFMVELAVRLAGYGRQRFFFGENRRWNWFDLALVVLSVPALVTTGANLNSLRMLRLFRVSTVVSRFESLQMVVEGLMGGLRSIAYIGLLQSILFYVYSVAGVVAFRENDPYHFGTVGDAMLTLFRTSTLEDWTDLLYNNMYGCDRWPYSTAACHTPNAAPAFAPAYFVSFVVVAALIMMSLIVGVVTMSMNVAVETIEERRRQQRRSRALRGHQAAREKREQARVSRHKPWTVAPEPAHHGILKRVGTVVSGGSRRGSTDWTLVADPAVAAAVARSGHARGWQRAYVVAKRLTLSAWFRGLILAVIVVSSVLVGVTAGGDAVSEATEEHLERFDYFVIAVFTFEILVKMLAKGPRPLRYFEDRWNVLEFVIVVAWFLPDTEANEGNWVFTLRLLRLLRVLRLVQAIGSLQVILGGLFKGMESLTVITGMLLLLFFIFAVIASWLFADNDPQHFAKPHTAMVTLFRCVTLDDWTDVMYINKNGCAAWADYPADQCTHSEAHGWVAIVFFVTFTILGALILLSLFVGVVTAGMTQANIEYKATARETSAVQRLLIEMPTVSDHAVERLRRMFVDVAGSIAHHMPLYDAVHAYENIGQWTPDRAALAAAFVKAGVDASLDASKIDLSFSQFVAFMLAVRDSHAQQVVTLSRRGSADASPTSTEGAVPLPLPGHGASLLGAVAAQLAIQEESAGERGDESRGSRGGGSRGGEGSRGGDGGEKEDAEEKS